MMDFNDAEKQRSMDLIPDSTIVPAQIVIRPGNAGSDGWAKRAKDSACMFLDCEFVVVEGEFAKRKFWSNLTIAGETDGQKRAVEITRARLRAMLESARGINPTDESAGAIERRRVSDYGDFDGLRFWAVVGVEEGKDGYKSKNTLKAIVTPDKKDWRQLEQTKVKRAPSTATAVQSQSAAAPASSKPSWA